MDMEIDSYAVKSQGEVEHLTARLKKLKEDLREYQVGDHVLGSQIPPHLREEIAKIYDEHGGIEILMEITKVAYNTIKQWHSKYKRNPTYFQYLNPCARFYRRRTFVDGIEKSDFDTPVKSTPDKMDKEQLKISQQFKNAKTPEEMKRLLSPEVYGKILAIKKSVEEVITCGRKKISPQLKHEISRCVIAAGSARPVALLLGLNERVLMSWKEFLVGELSKVPSAYKLN